MTYEELCDLLLREFGSCSVYVGERPNLTDELDSTAEHVIGRFGGEYRVGGVERGKFITSAIFMSEDAACRYVYNDMVKSAAARASAPRSTESDVRNASLASEKLRRTLLMPIFNCERLVLKLSQVGVDPRRYSIGRPAEEVLCLQPRGDGTWEIFSFDRGEKENISVWPDEETACLGFLGKMAWYFWAPSPAERDPSRNDL